MYIGSKRNLKRKEERIFFYYLLLEQRTLYEILKEERNLAKSMQC